MNASTTFLNPPSTTLKVLSLICLLCAFTVVGLGAYARLTDAGLGCPDWPGCYGQIAVPKSQAALAAANLNYPQRPVEPEKAFNEMIHRYLAGFLGLLIFLLAALHVKQRTRHAPLTLGLSLLVIGQALLGMWTVTLSLFPTVVTSHLLGGFTLFSLLSILTFEHLGLSCWRPPNSHRRKLKYFSVITLVAIVLQVLLGGWTASNYAATICTALPVCEGQWWAQLNFAKAFQLWGHGVSDYEFATHISPDVKLTIHVLHRLGAIIVSLVTFSYGAYLWRCKARMLAAILLILLVIQIVLGISNVLNHLPLLNAVAHNVTGAALMAWMFIITYRVFVCKT